MADFTMCKATDCPVKNLCYRYRAPPDLVQPYFQAPFDHKKQHCKAFKAVGLRLVMSVEDAEGFWSKHA